jgi:hypothetical protein
MSPLSEEKHALFFELTTIVGHIAENEYAHLLLSIGGVVFKVYPGRYAALTKPEKLKRFAAFVLALKKIEKDDDFAFSLRGFGDFMEIGIVHADGMEWLPCEVSGTELPARATHFTIPSLEGEPERDVPIRRIVL